MSVGNCAEPDAEILSVAQDAELQPFSVADPAGDPLGAGGGLFEKFQKLPARPVAGIGRYVEHVGGFQTLEYSEQLLL